MDSTTALSVVESLKELASKRGCTIIMTIHQPSLRLFNLIDKVLFLSNGKVTFNGTIKSLTPFITDIYSKANLGEVPQGNQAEVFLDLCDQLITENRLEIVTNIYEQKDNVIATDTTNGNAAVPSYANSFLKEVMVLAHRGQLNVRRYHPSIHPSLLLSLLLLLLLLLLLTIIIIIIIIIIIKNSGTFRCAFRCIHWVWSDDRDAVSFHSKHFDWSSAPSLILCIHRGLLLLHIVGSATDILTRT